MLGIVVKNGVKVSIGSKVIKPKSSNIRCEKIEVINSTL